MESLRTENLAILLTDIKGFTARTRAQTRSENERWLACHEALVMPVVSGFGGVRRKAIGDALLITFRSPTNAVLCASAIQDRLALYNREVAERERLEVRAILTMGEVRIEADEVLGEATVLAQRLEGMVDAGAVVFSESLYLAMNKAEVQADELGLRTVCDISEPVRLYGLRRDETKDTPYGARSLGLLSTLPRIEKQWVDGLREDPTRRLNIDLHAVRKASRFRSGRGFKGSLQARHDWSNRLRFARAFRGWRGWRMRRSWWGVSISVLLGGVIVMAVLGTNWFASQVSDIEALIDEGRVIEAERAMVRWARDHPEQRATRAYLEGYLAWAREQRWVASKAYGRALDLDHRKYLRNTTIYGDMAVALDDDDCAVRSEAAKVLAKLGEPQAISALEAAIEREEDRGSFLSKIFKRCGFERHAREAIESLLNGRSSDERSAYD